ncbi:MAG TPA: ABC transporter substrate-binding protein [Chloroflexota bacterium]|nr:ABC transporter substrate-binding protein [Chloroflexota bacterium]
MRGLACLALSALLVAACAGGRGPESGTASGASAAAPSATPPPTQVRASYSVVSGAMAPLWLADEAGLWRQHGLEVELTFISGGPNTMTALVAGETHFAAAAGDSALNIQAREPDVVAFLNLSVGSQHRLIVNPAIQRVEDLRGRRIGVATIGDGVHMLMSKALRQLGFNPERDFVWTPVGGGGTAGLINALAAGAIDAAPLSPPNDLIAIRQGGHALLSLADFDLPSVGLAAYTLRRTLEQQRPVVEAFAAGVIDGIRLFKADPALAKEILKQRIGTTDQEVIDWSYEANGRHMPDRPFIDRERVREAIETLVAGNPELQQVQVERAFDTSVLEALEARGYFRQR